MAKVLPNRLYLFLTLKWVNPNFCVILYLLFNAFILFMFKKKKKAPVGTGGKLNVLCTFNLRPVPTGAMQGTFSQKQA